MLRNIITDMRTELSRAITLENGNTISLASIGIRLSANPADGAMLRVDENVLNEALANNMEGVSALFTGVGAQGENQGVAARLDSALNTYITGHGTGRISDRAGIVGRPSEGNNNMTRNVMEQDRRIDNMFRWLERRESQLFAQFSRLEMAMMQSQQQMMFWDSVMFGSQPGMR
jgi:flagellar hook-associated protein 2